MTACDLCAIEHSPCDECGGTVHIGDWPMCKGDPAKHQPAGPRGGFKEFTVELDGVQVTVTSLQHANKIERESLARYNSFDSAGKRRGAPYVFRHLHQNHSNIDKNTLTELGQQSQGPNPVNSRGERMSYGFGRPRS